jgi:hypothetical protein
MAVPRNFAAALPLPASTFSGIRAAGYEDENGFTSAKADQPAGTVIDPMRKPAQLAKNSTRNRPNSQQSSTQWHARCAQVSRNSSMGTLLWLQALT